MWKFVNYFQIDQKKRGSLFSGLLIFSFSGVVLMGCEVSRETLCGELPQITDEIAHYRIEIAQFDPKPEPKSKARPSRKLASISLAPREVTAEEREAWMVWGERALKRTQWAKDALEDDRRGRHALPALTDAGLSLVSFHGFLEQKKWRKASLELDHVEAYLGRARQLACEVEVAPKSRKKNPP